MDRGTSRPSCSSPGRPNTLSATSAVFSTPLCSHRSPSSRLSVLRSKICARRDSSSAIVVLWAIRSENTPRSLPLPTYSRFRLWSMSCSTVVSRCNVRWSAIRRTARTMRCVRLTRAGYRRRLTREVVDPILHRMRCLIKIVNFNVQVRVLFVFQVMELVADRIILLAGTMIHLRWRACRPPGVNERSELFEDGDG